MAMISHRQARRLIQVSVDIPMHPTEQVRLDEHLAACEECRQYAGRITRFESELGQAMHARWDRRSTSIPLAAIQSHLRRYRMKKIIWGSIGALGAIAIVAALLIFVIPLIRTQSPARTGTGGLQTPSQIPGATLAGDWTAATDFGRILFTVDSTGTWVMRTRIEFNTGWTCGPETNFNDISITDQMRIPNDENSVFGLGWPVGDVGQFHVTVVWKTHNATSRTFLGYWEVIVGTSKCSGDWTAGHSNSAK
jgi:hypothetical protein